MKCPCGCNREIPNGHYWASESCGKKANKKGLFMPKNGVWREASRVMRKINSLKKGKNHG